MLSVIDTVIGISPTIVSLIGIIFKVGKFRNSEKDAIVFKKIRKEYTTDKMTAYYHIQSHLGLRLSKKEMDYIIDSEDAYSIMKIIKTAHGCYNFNDRGFETNLSKRSYILPIIGYFVSSFFILEYFLNYIEIQKFLGTLPRYWFVAVILISLFGPILYTCATKMRQISAALFLEKISKRNKNSDASSL